MLLNGTKDFVYSTFFSVCCSWPHWWKGCTTRWRFCSCLDLQFKQPWDSSVPKEWGRQNTSNRKKKKSRLIRLQRVFLFLNKRSTTINLFFGLIKVVFIAFDSFTNQLMFPKWMKAIWNDSVVKTPGKSEKPETNPVNWSTWCFWSTIIE